MAFISKDSQRPACTSSEYTRKDVIFKNLLRDIRKFYTKELNEKIQFKRKQRMNGPTFYQECVYKLIELKFSEAQMLALNVTLEELYLILGCMIYPKKMTKIDNEKS